MEQDATMMGGGTRGPQLSSHPPLGQHAGATETRSAGTREGECGHHRHHHHRGPGDARERKRESPPGTTE